MKEVKLPSGAVLKVNPAPFSVAKSLYQSLLRVGINVAFESGAEIGELLKNLLCIGLSSPDIEKILGECFKRCTYDKGDGSGDLKINEDTFEPVKAREDYPVVCMAVGEENLAPFVKSLYAEFLKLLASAESGLK